MLLSDYKKVGLEVIHIRKEKLIKGTEVKTRPDELLHTFWSDKQNFADLFNSCLFAGEEIIQATELVECDTTYSELIVGKELFESLERIRDVIKMTAFHTEFVLLGIENQNKVHYAMPLRTMMYDALGYVKQCKEIEKHNKQRMETGETEGLTGTEFLSGLKKTDKLTAQFTIVIYYGESEWDGPRTLKETLLIAGKICGVKEWLAMAIEQKEEVITMSAAWEEAKQELREEGREEGRKEFKNILLLLKKGKSKEELLDIGYDEKIIDDAIFIM